MPEIQPIRTKRDYDEALARVDALMDAEPDSAEDRELDLLVDLVVAYEERHVPMGYPRPEEAIKYTWSNGAWSQEISCHSLGAGPRSPRCYLGGGRSQCRWRKPSTRTSTFQLGRC